MYALPRNLPDLFRKAGLKVICVDGWEDRLATGSSRAFGPVGVLNHHTGVRDIIGDFTDDLSYATWMAKVGRSDLSPSLVQIALSLEGTLYLLARGRANHAGTAKASGSVAAGDGNYLYVGIEWMLSGTQPIPATMYEAAVKANAVLLDVLGSSEQAVSCHYKTSVTGKWDIGDPNGTLFNGSRVLDVVKFRKAVKTYRRKVKPPAAKDFTIVEFQLSPMQFSDTDAQMGEDTRDLFSRHKHVLAGTEAGGVKAQPLPDLLREAASLYNYRFHIGRGDWLAIDRDLISGGWAEGYIPVLESHEGAGKHTDRGIPWVSFETEKMGRITVGVGHYLTNGRRPGQPNYDLNRRYADAIGDFGRRFGKGSNKVFYLGDQNIVDRTGDTFFGSPFTTAWDELEKWQNTGHGNIDVIASWDEDGAVEAVGARSLDDHKFSQHSDHFVTEAEFKIRHTKEKAS